MSRVALARIPSLTFYKDELTLSRRGDPISQLTCIGKPCRLYQPEAVRCVNAGGQGTDVDWKCEADLPESLRFGKVEVSCEGWTGPGDPYVLKESCALEYRLVQVPDALRNTDYPRYPHFPSGSLRMPRWLNAAYSNPSAAIFTIIWVACLVLILYLWLKSCFSERASSNNSRVARPRPPGGGPSSSWFSGNHHPDSRLDPPPPYSKSSNHTSSNSGDQGWRPGFWTGAALGWLTNWYQNRGERERLRPAAYDWEHDQLRRPAPAFGQFFQRQSSGWDSGSRRRPIVSSSDDRSEGPSNLGAMRQSTGIGGSKVR